MSRTHKSLSPRIHEVHNRGSKTVKFYTDYDQRLWPIPGKDDEKGSKKSPDKGSKS
jgi:hypothetical protein